MVDTREAILVRLLELVATVPNIRSVHRNNIEISAESQCPAVVLMDGDEETGDAEDVSMRPPQRPTKVRMTPEIFVLQQDEEVGSELTAWRAELIKLVLTDTELNEQIVKTGRHGNGAIRYLGCQTNLGWLRELYGALGIQFMFSYTLKPEDL